MTRDAHRSLPHTPSVHPGEEKAGVLVPARMLNEVVYCPRLAYIEWVEGDFRDNVFTLEGRFEHRRVDARQQTLPEPSDRAKRPQASTSPRDERSSSEARAASKRSGGEGRPPSSPNAIHARSVYLSAPRAGIVAKIDIVEASGGDATPVDYKRGKPPRAPEQRAWDPERVQLCAQAIVLEENGFRCNEGVLYFTGAKTRVTIPIDDELRRRTLAAVVELRGLAEARKLPPPLVDSPKCRGCSLAGICLPDEVNLLRGTVHGQRVRRLLPARDDALPLHVQDQGARVGRRGELLRIKTRDGDAREVRLREVSHVGLFGNVQVSTQALRELCAREIPVTFSSYAGWFYGIAGGLPHKNVLLRIAQYAAAESPERVVEVARSLVAQKVRNQRTLLRRNGEASRVEGPLVELRRLVRQAERAETPETLLGLEGTAARIYFASLPALLRGAGEEALVFDMHGRNRRPPRDPINALLSFTYALLVKELTVVLATVGFDPYRGIYHRPRYGRPSLALDLMEPFRPLIADSVVLAAVNNGVVSNDDFLRAAGAVTLKPHARRRMIQAYERRMQEKIKHPTFGYRISYRRVLEVQARLTARFLLGELDEFPTFVTR